MINASLEQVFLNIVNRKYPQGKNSGQSFNEVYEKNSFDWFHLGKIHINFSEIKQLFREHSHQAPRSGHLGNWLDISKGKAGPLDYNWPICFHEKLGIPHIYDLNITESRDLSSGDSIYLPLSKVSSGKREILKGYINGKIIDHKKSFFTPYVTVESNDGLIRLKKYHDTRNSLKIPYRYESDLICGNHDMFYNLLIIALNESANGKFPLARIIDRIVEKNGQVKKIKPVFVNSGIKINNRFYDYENIIEYLYDTYLCISKNVDELKYIDRPLLSQTFTSFLSLYFNKNISINHEDIIFHFHWGAIGMAGYPVKKDGYFDTDVRYIRKLFDIFYKNGIDKHIYFILIPSVPYLLWYHADYEDMDKGPIENLLSNVKYSKLTNIDLLQSQNIVDSVVNKWLKENTLSGYFLGRFMNPRTVLYEASGLSVRGLKMPDGFDDLSIPLLTMIIGSLITELQK